MALTRTITHMVAGEVVTQIAQLWFYQSGTVVVIPPQLLLYADSIAIKADSTIITADGMAA